jgi:HlyD family secretion protein
MVKASTPVSFPAQLPSSLLMTGYAIIFFCITVLLAISYAIRYDDIVRSDIVITTNLNPINLSAKTTGSIQLLLSAGETTVQADDYVAVVDNAASLKDMYTLRESLLHTEARTDAADLWTKLRRLSCGDAQVALANLIETCKEYQIYMSTHKHDLLMDSKHQQIDILNERLSILENKSTLLKDDVRLSQKEELSNKTLFEQQVISEKELERSMQQKIGKELFLFDNYLSANEIKVRIQQIKDNILQEEKQHQLALKKYDAGIDEKLAILRRAFAEWEQRYAIKAPVNGKFLPKPFLKDKKHILANDEIGIILQQDSTISGIMKVPVRSSGKVKAGQQVLVKLDNYPAYEYGVVKGFVQTVSSTPTEGFYEAEMRFDKRLMTTYNIELPFSHFLSGKGEIIVGKTNFWERLTHNIKDRVLNR